MAAEHRGVLARAVEGKLSLPPRLSLRCVFAGICFCAVIVSSIGCPMPVSGSV